MASADNAIPPGESPEPYLEEAHDPRRRDFINVAAVAFAGVGAGVVVLPLVNQMSPSADVLALSTTEVDLSKIAEGQAVTTSFRSQPLRSEEHTSELQSLMRISYAVFCLKKKKPI